MGSVRSKDLNSEREEKGLQSGFHRRTDGVSGGWAPYSEARQEVTEVGLSGGDQWLDSGHPLQEDPRGNLGALTRNVG